MATMKLCVGALMVHGRTLAEAKNDIERHGPYEESYLAIHEFNDGKLVGGWDFVTEWRPKET